MRPGPGRGGWRWTYLLKLVGVGEKSPTVATHVVDVNIMILEAFCGAVVQVTGVAQVVM
jgi:hypothetical protein